MARIILPESQPLAAASHNKIARERCQRTFEDVGHFAQFRERDSGAPGLHDAHQMRLEALHVLLLVDRQLRFGRHFGDPQRRVLKETWRL